MYFRESKTRLQCMRTIYDKDKKRGVEKTVASLDRWTPKITDDVREALTADELKQLEELLASKQSKQDSDLLRLTLTGTLSRYLERGVEALKSPESLASLTKEEAAKIWQGLDDMRRELRRAGFDRPGKGD